MATPISVSPSQDWDGNDGPWSSFAIRIGTPPQTVRVLASTTVPETWVVSTGDCVATDPADCSDSRGVLFSPNASSTWNNVGNFALDVEKNLRNYSSDWDHGNYGFDTLALGYLSSGGPTVESSVIAGLNTKDFYLGSIGLSPQPRNFTATDNPAPSLLGSLKIRRQIPSLSYGYSAGAPYRLKKVLGSLTLGGYDASRRPPNETITFTFGDNISRDLLVGLQSIEYSDTRATNKRLLSEGILTFIDSTVPHIWLPLDACKAFESAFGLQYDNDTDLYLVNSTLHEILIQQNASISFLLGNSVQGGETVNITFPYASFDLQVQLPNCPGVHPSRAALGLEGPSLRPKDNHGGIEMEGTGGGAELHGSGGVAEMEGAGARVELDAVHVYELPAGEVRAKVPRSESGQERIRIAKLARLRRKEQRSE
ncbi:MAG: hypothetical protein LQ349_008390 [Xanthoria aureola]|nr:MAG: hypothetical protein LQ349_008390 [Xanthoria aureola]